MNDFQSVYILIREYLKNGSHEEQLPDNIQKLYRQYLQILIQGIERQAVESVREETEKYEYIKGVYEKYLKSEKTAMDIAYRLGIAVGESKVGAAWLREQTDENTFGYNMNILLSRAHIKDIVTNIYYDPGIQHKILAGRTEIKANYLNQLASLLEKIQCIRRYGTGKCTYYELTVRGKEYVRKLLGAENERERKRNYFEELSKFNMEQEKWKRAVCKKVEKEEGYAHEDSMSKMSYHIRSENKIISFPQYTKETKLLEK